MQRLLPWLALICAVAIAAVAAIELTQRSDDDRLALEPTALPSPTGDPSESPTPEPTTDETATPRATRGPADAEETPRATRRAPAAPAPTEPTETTAPTETQEPTPTPEPPRTPEPEPLGTPGAVDASGDRTPRTGGGAVMNGLVLFAIAIALRTLIDRRGRSY